MRPVTLYHVTTAEKAETILRNGFLETDGFFGRGRTPLGIWLYDRPLNPNGGAVGEAVLAVTLKVEPSELSFYELVDDAKSYRQWCLPAGLIRTHGKISVVPKDASERLTDIEFLEKVCAGVNTSSLYIRQSIAAVNDSEALLSKIERLLNGRVTEHVDARLVADSLQLLVRDVITQTGGKARAAFYLADISGRTLHHITGMPEAYARCVDGFAIGPQSLACGLAAGTRQAVITRDVCEEPRWRPWLWLAEEFGYRACWSFPVQTSAGKILGTFAIYYAEPTNPTQSDLALAAALTHRAANIVTRHRPII